MGGKNQVTAHGKPRIFKSCIPESPGRGFHTPIPVCFFCNPAPGYECQFQWNRKACTQFLYKHSFLLKFFLGTKAVVHPAGTEPGWANCFNHSQKQGHGIRASRQGNEEICIMYIRSIGKTKRSTCRGKGTVLQHLNPPFKGKSRPEGRL
jgi:hypothetical protein